MAKPCKLTTYGVFDVRGTVEDQAEFLGQVKNLGAEEIKHRY
jgi:hypothetical protein